MSIDEQRATDASLRFFKLLCNFSGRSQAYWDAHGEHQLLAPCGTHSLGFTLKPFERYLGIKRDVRRNVLFNKTDDQEIKVSDIVVCRVTHVFGSIISTEVVDVIGRHRRWLEDLRVKATCRLSDEELKKQHTGFDGFEVGDTVKGVVTSVNTVLSELQISLDARHLTSENMSQFPLGKIEVDDPGYRDFRAEQDERQREDSYLEDVRSCPSYLNPSCTRNLISALGIDARHSSFLNIKSSRIPDDEFADHLRERQSYTWSMGMVEIGVKHFKSGETEEAKKCFDQAITFYPRCVEAFVARGALKANSNQLKDAVGDFRDALAINPKHRNGRKYCVDTLMSLAKSYERSSKWKSSFSCYKEVLELDSSYHPARERMLLAQQLIRKEAEAGQSSGIASSSGRIAGLTGASKEKIIKLKRMLEQKLTKTEKEPNLKETPQKKKRFLHRESSSSSGSSSSTTDTASGDDCWVEASSGDRLEASFDDAHGRHHGSMFEHEHPRDCAANEKFVDINSEKHIKEFVSSSKNSKVQENKRVADAERFFAASPKRMESYTQQLNSDGRAFAFLDRSHSSDRFPRARTSDDEPRRSSLDGVARAGSGPDHDRLSLQSTRGLSYERNAPAGSLRVREARNEK